MNLTMRVVATFILATGTNLLAAGELVRTSDTGLPRPSGGIATVEIRDSGDIVAIDMQDGVVRIASPNGETKIVNGLPAPLHAAALSGEDVYATYLDGSGTSIVQFNLPTGRVIRTVKLRGLVPLSIAVSAQGTIFVVFPTAARDHIIHKINAAGEVVSSFGSYVRSESLAPELVDSVNGNSRLVLEPRTEELYLISPVSYAATVFDLDGNQKRVIQGPADRGLKTSPDGSGDSESVVNLFPLSGGRTAFVIGRRLTADKYTALVPTVEIVRADGTLEESFDTRKQGLLLAVDRQERFYFPALDGIAVFQRK